LKPVLRLHHGIAMILEERGEDGPVVFLIVDDENDLLVQWASEAGAGRCGEGRLPRPSSCRSPEKGMAENGERIATSAILPLIYRLSKGYATRRDIQLRQAAPGSHRAPDVRVIPATGEEP
jgi:hypothetical protein